MSCRLRDNKTMAGGLKTSTRTLRDARLRKHADYQRVYRESRKQSSPSMSYFYSLRAPIVKPDNARTANDRSGDPRGPRIGLTAGRVMGKAVNRNRIKRRMREAVRRNLNRLAADVDVVLHPRRSVLTIEFSKLDQEVGRIFASVESAIAKARTQPPASSSANPRPHSHASEARR
jgi:ribonuclease P protein component